MTTEQGQPAPFPDLLFTDAEGNEWDLRNVLERAALLCGRDALEASDLRFESHPSPGPPGSVAIAPSALGMRSRAWYSSSTLAKRSRGARRRQRSMAAAKRGSTVCATLESGGASVWVTV